MNPSIQYFDAVNAVIRRIHEHEGESVLRAANVLADQIANGHLIHVIGTGGHSMIGAEEIFYRAGGLVPVNPIFETGMSLKLGAVRSTTIERTPNLVPNLLSKVYRLKTGEALLIVNAYGVNAASIDAALEAKRLGLTTIGITGTETADALAPDHPSRHPSGQKLYECVDIFVNTYVPLGDAVVTVPGVTEKVGSVSTFANAFALGWIVVETVTQLAERGIQPPLWQSANSPGGDEHNQAYLDKYIGVIRHL